jgi:hypothetical protein
LLLEESTRGDRLPSRPLFSRARRGYSLAVSAGVVCESKVQLELVTSRAPGALVDIADAAIDD